MTMNIFRFAASIAICQAAGLIGSFFTAQSVGTWYADLTKPSFSPPNWIFAPVWITLYTLMGISLYLMWRQAQETKVPSRAFVVFGFQLALNALWSFLFFGLRSPSLGVVNIFLLWIAIVATLLVFWKGSRVSALLLVPYLLWVTFAGVLNFEIWRLNGAQ